MHCGGVQIKNAKNCHCTNTYGPDFKYFKRDPQQHSFAKGEEIRPFIIYALYDNWELEVLGITSIKKHIEDWRKKRLENRHDDETVFLCVVFNV